MNKKSLFLLLIVGLLVGLSSVSADLTTDNVAYWTLDNTLADATGNGYTLTNTGATYTSNGVINGAYDFDGTNDYMNTNYNPVITEWTYSGWIKTTATSRGDPLGGLKEDGANDIFTILYTNVVTNKAGIQVGDGTGTTVSSSGSTTINDGAWHHLVFRLSASENKAQLYVDAVLDVDETFTFSSVDLSSNGGLYVGNVNVRGSAGNSWFDGTLDEPSIWNRAFTPGEVRRLHSFGVGLRYEDLDNISVPVDGTVAYYKLDNDVLDAKNNTHDLTNNGATYTADGKINGAYDFDGTNYLDTGLTQSDSDFSISMWVKADTISSSGMFNNVINDGSRDGFQVQLLSADGWRMVFFDGGSVTINAREGSPTGSTNTWYHVVLTYDASTNNALLYVNNTVVLDETGGLGSSTDNLLISGVYHGIDYFDGVMDEPAIWNRALSTSEINYLYASGSPGEEQQYPFSTSVTVTAADDAMLFGGGL